MASLKALQQRMRSVGNIQKITSAMKMVSAAKFKHDERRMNAGLPFAAPVKSFFDKLPEPDRAALPGITLLTMGSDKGLCGGINGGVSKATRLRAFDEEKQGANVEMYLLGNKPVPALKRLFGDRIQRSFEGTQQPWSFTQASVVAERIIENDPQRACIIHNTFVNMVAYDVTQAELQTKQSAKAVDKAEWSKVVDVYNFEPPAMEGWDDLHEFYYASSIFGAYLTGTAAEQSARMAAMENASKNCAEMLEKLTLKFNRARQAKITTELCEIISGASAV